MVWALDLDDFTGDFCGEGKWPLMTAIKTSLSEGKVYQFWIDLGQTILYKISYWTIKWPVLLWMALFCFISCFDQLRIRTRILKGY